MRWFRAWTATGLLTMVVLSWILLAEPASAAPDPDSAACQRQGTLVDAKAAGVHVSAGVLRLVEYHCEQGVEQDEFHPVAPVAPWTQARGDVCTGVEDKDPAAAKDYLDQVDQANCIADWVEYVNYTQTRPAPCVEVANAVRQGRSVDDEQEQACEEADPSYVPPPLASRSGDQGGASSSFESLRTWWGGLEFAAKGLACVCCAITLLIPLYAVASVFGGDDPNKPRPPEPPPSNPGGYQRS